MVVRGWAFLHSLSRAGQIYVGLVQEERDEVFLVGTERVIRGDVGVVHRDAPLCAGFIGRFMPLQGYARPLDGAYRITLINVSGEVFGSCMTDLVAVFDNGMIISTARADVSEAQALRAKALIAAKAEI